MFRKKVYFRGLKAAMALSLKNVISVNISLRDIGLQIWGMLLSTHIRIVSHSALSDCFGLKCFALPCCVVSLFAFVA